MQVKRSRAQRFNSWLTRSRNVQAAPVTASIVPILRTALAAEAEAEANANAIAIASANDADGGPHEATLAAVDLILAEDTRVSHRLMPVSEVDLPSLDDIIAATDAMLRLPQS